MHSFTDMRRSTKLYGSVNSSHCNSFAGANLALVPNRVARFISDVMGSEHHGITLLRFHRESEGHIAIELFTDEIPPLFVSTRPQRHTTNDMLDPGCFATEQLYQQ